MNIQKIKTTFILFIVLFAISLTYSQNAGVCVMRGICGDTELGTIPCTNKSDTIILNQNTQMNLQSLSLFEAMCPHIHEKTDPEVCCDEFQLESMFITVYNLAHLGFNHCPSCLKNIEKMFCEMNCSPKQNKFIKVKKLKRSESGEHFATEIDYYITESFAKGIYDSCKNVRNFEGKVIDSMCGGLKGEECTAKDWFNYLGRYIEEDGISPFKVNFHLINGVTKVGSDSFESLDTTYVKCSENVNQNLSACDCHHCPDSCPHNHKKRDIKSKRDKRESNKCLMKGICDETAFGVIPCASDEKPTPIADPIALKELRQMCPHLVTSDTQSVCCTDEQVIRLNQTFEMIAIFLKECPACVRNLEKIFCHLSCGRDQQEFIKITKTSPNESGKQMVTELQYFVNDDWAKGIYESCKGVHRLGSNVLNHYCKPYKGEDCDHQKFLQYIGGNAEHFGHSPYDINFILTNEEIVESDGIQYKPTKQTFYKCSDKTHTGEDKCPCVHCDQSCSAGETKIIRKQMPKYIGKKMKRETNAQELDILTTYLDDIAHKFSDYEAYADNEYCIFDTTCRYNSRYANIPCLKIKKPIPLTDTNTLRVYNEICPQLADSDIPNTCCDSDFIHQMSSIFKLLDKFGLSECPSCMHNLRQILCQFTCSPKQNKMIRVLNATKVNSHVLIEHLEYYINADFAQNLYDSCKSIHNGTLMDTMCGKWGQIKKCSAKKWLDFMGLSAKSGGYSPFQMDIKLSNAKSININGVDIYPMNEKSYSCTESPSPDSHSCPCAHCQEACL